MTDWFGHWQWDRWEIVGFAGEALFFARLLAQWASSEYARKPVLPIVYWYLSLAGCFLLVIYAWQIGRPAVLLPQIIGVAIYARNLQLELRYRRRQRWWTEVGFDRPEYPWPHISVVVPVHNEEKTLADTLAALCQQHYPRERYEIIAALNGCTDGSAEIARRFPVKIVESDRAGISFGRNLGSRAASGEILVFCDADTILAPEALTATAEAMHGRERAVAVFPGRPASGGLGMRICLWIANLDTRWRRVAPPSGALAIRRALFQTIGGFDENLPQGTCTDLIMRALAAGADYIFIDGIYGTTSIRRFAKRGVVQQMLAWRRNHHDLARGCRERIAKRAYEVIR